MINKKIIKHIDNISSSEHVAEFIKKLIAFEDSDKGNHRWKDTYQSEVDKYYLIGGDND